MPPSPSPAAPPRPPADDRAVDWLALPPECWLLVLGQLDAAAHLVAVARVCRQLRDLALHEGLWQALAARPPARLDELVSVAPLQRHRRPYTVDLHEPRWRRLYAAWHEEDRRWLRCGDGTATVRAAFADLDVECFTLATDGVDALLLGTANGTVYSLDPHSLALHGHAALHSAAVTHLVVEPAFGGVVSASLDGTVAIPGQPKPLLVHPSGVLCVETTPRFVLCGTGQGHIIVLRRDTCEVCFIVPNAHAARVTGLRITAGRLLSAGGDGIVRVWRWDATTGAIEPDGLPLFGHKAMIAAMDVWGDYVATGSYDAAVHLWDLRTRTLVHKMAAHSHNVYGVFMDRWRLITCSHDQTIRVWNWRTPKLLSTLTLNQGSIDDVIIAKGYLFCITSSRKLIRIEFC